MAQEEGLRNLTFVAGTGVGVYSGVPGKPGSVSPHPAQYRAVKGGSAAKEVVLADAADSAPISIVGVVGNTPQGVGHPVTVGVAGISPVLVGTGGVSAWDPLKIEDGGAFVTATLPGDAAAVVAIAQQDGVEDEVIPALLKLGS